MEEIIIGLILESLANAVTQAVSDGISYIIKKAVDETGKMITQIVYEFDSDGDGTNDSEQVIYTLDYTIPNLDNGYCLVNKGNEIGLGLPEFRLVDSEDVLPKLRDLNGFLSDGNGFIIDLDDDGMKDDILFPLPFDFTGDGIPDFQIVVDDDDNGIPDVSPYSPFYPIGSDEYQYIIETHSDSEVPALDKSFQNYTVTEALLFLIFIASAIGVASKFFKRRKI